MSLAAPARRHVPRQPHVHLVNQGRRRKRLTPLLPSKPPGRKAAKLLVDQRKKLLGCPGIPLFDDRQNPGDFLRSKARGPGLFGGRNDAPKRTQPSIGPPGICVIRSAREAPSKRFPLRTKTGE